ncbi:alpha-(1-_3)-arabinofuranosyltransferase family protein [Streptomyces sp. NPDC060194]|uniref:alpha-(1->3)-arabinofuranosyltransferase domain-containing protein n=1 Tax=Streptomyces sp. NPDC060194 TaxID=3347069 RepID=UPI0036570379
MTSTVAPPRPPATRPPAEPRRQPPADGPRSRRWLLGFWAAVFLAFVAAAPGRMTFETKLGVAYDPWRFLGDLGQLWNDQAGFGGIFNQYVGYAFPMLPYYALTDLLQIPVWLAERLWLSLIVAAAFWGALRLAERLGVGTPSTRALGAVVYALWPTYTIIVGSTSAGALPGALLPWVLLPLTNFAVAPRLAAARSALLIPFMGGVNAASTLAALLPVFLYVVSRRPRLLAWWAPFVVLATAWWVVPLLLLGSYGENFLPYVETSETTTATMSATEMLRGAGNWVGYLNFGDPWLPAGWAVATSALVIVCSAFAAAIGLAGLASRGLPERRWLVLTATVVVLVTLAGYAGAFGGPFSGPVQDALQSWLAPFRNIYKFQPGLALVLVLGIMHITASLRPGKRFVPLVATVLIVPGLLWPYLSGAILQPGSFSDLPKYWSATADWLEKNSPDSRAYVTPATAHGIYTWGSPIDQPLDVLAESHWAQRDYVPFGTPGNRRTTDAVEQALLSGGKVPGLAEYLSRAGLHYVVVRNDLDPDQIGYVPSTTVKRTLEESGYQRVTGFGPVMTNGRIANDTPIQVEGLYPRQRAVEVYAPADADALRPGQARLYPAANTAVVSGGPESLLPLAADPSLKDRPTVLAGDATPGVGEPALRVSGDGLRRADTRFGLVGANTSYTYTSTERNPQDNLQDPGKEPRQILPSTGQEHQTVAELKGAKAVTASSSGNWLFHLPQFDPVNAFDGDPATDWAEGSSGSPEGEWVRIAFDRTTDVPETLRITPMPADALRSAPTRVRIETERGAVNSWLKPNGEPQDVEAPAGPTDWLKVTVIGVQEGGAGLVGTGFSDIDIPGVTVKRTLALPKDGKAAQSFSLTQGQERGLDRTFETEVSGSYELTGTARAVQGPELDKLLYGLVPEKPTGKLVVTADSTARYGTSVSPRNLTDGDLTTAWIAGDKAVLHLKWPTKTAVGEIIFAAAGGLSTRAEEVQISSPDGAVVAGVDKNGAARFTPITTDRMDITVSKVADLKLANPLADEKLQLPVGLTEVYVPALDGLRAKQPAADRPFTTECGQGPMVSVDGKPYQTRAEGVVGDLRERRPVKVALCGAEESLTLSPGEHRVEAAAAGPLAFDHIALTSGETPEPAASERELKIDDWAGDERKVTVGSGEASYLTTYQNANDGWKATLDGKELSSVRLDGWQQGWLIPSGEGGDVSIEFTPAKTYDIGLVAAGVALLVLIGAALFRRKEENARGPEPTEAPAPGLVLGAVVLTLVMVVVAGPLALLVPVLAVVAWFRSRLLAVIAFVAMTVAGVIAAVGAGEAPARDAGAFSPAAQVFALIALVAALVTVGGQGVRARRDEAGTSGYGPEREPVPAAAGAGSGAAAGSAAGSSTGSASGDTLVGGPVPAQKTAPEEESSPRTTPLRKEGPEASAPAEAPKPAETSKPAESAAPARSPEPEDARPAESAPDKPASSRTVGLRKEPGKESGG